MDLDDKEYSEPMMANDSQSSIDHEQQPVNPNPSQEYKEVEKLQQRDTIYEDKVLSDYLKEKPGDKITPLPNDIDELAHTVQTPNSKVTNEELRDSNIVPNEPEKRIRRQRRSRYNIENKEEVFKQIVQNLKVELQLGTLFGLSPELRKYVNNDTKAQLVDPQVTQVETKAMEVNQVNEIDNDNPQDSSDVHRTNIPTEDETDLDYDIDRSLEMLLETYLTDVDTPKPSISQPLIKFQVSIANEEMTGLYDSGSNSSLISESTANRLGLPIQHINANITGINPGNVQINKMINTLITINRFEFPILLLVHPQMSDNVILIGRAFQEQHCFLIGYLDETGRKELLFRLDGLFHKFKLTHNGLWIQTEAETDKTKEQIQQLLQPLLDASILTPDEKDYFVTKLIPISRVLKADNEKLGRVTGFPPVTINLKPHVPWRLKNIPIGPLKAVAVNMFQQMLSEGLMERSLSCYRNPWFLCRKANNDYRLLTDFRTLNDFCTLESAHPANIAEIIATLGNKFALTTIDISNAYYHIPIQKASRDFTAILTPIGLLNYRVLPQGFKNAISVFSNLLAEILAPMGHCLEQFVDDVCIYADDADAVNESNRKEVVKRHLDNVYETLNLLNQHGLKINPAKLQLARKECEFLGYTISDKGATVLRKRVSAFQEFPVPDSVSKLERFLGMAGYYHNLIPGYAEIVNPLHRLVVEARKAKTKKITFQQNHLDRFNYLKKCFTHPPLVVTPHKEQELILFTDASLVSWAGVLETTDGEGAPHVVDCVSGAFQNAEKNYSIFEKECLALVKSLDKLRIHLMNYDQVLTVRCDNQALMALLNNKLSALGSNRLARWLNYLRNQNMRFKHIDGLKNIVADCLSRIEDPAAEPVTTLALQEDIDDLKARLEVKSNWANVTPLKELKYGKVDMIEIRNYLKTLIVPEQYENDKKLRKSFTTKAHEFFMEDEVMYKIGRQGQFCRRVILVPEEVDQIFRTAHEENGHMKMLKLFHQLNLMFFIPNLYERLREYLKSCHTCQLFDGTVKSRDPLYLSEPGGMFETVCCDSIKMDNGWLVVGRDEFSCWAEAMYLETLDASKIAKFLYREFISRFGNFRVLKVDNGAEWKNEVVEKLTQYYDIRTKFSIQYHPQGNAVIERNHVNLVSFLKKIPKELDWRDFIDSALKADRNMIRQTTGLSPHYMVYGYLGHSDLSLLYSCPPSCNDYTQEELFKFRFEQLHFREDQYLSAERNFQRERLKSKVEFDARHDIKNPVNVGDLVLVWDRPHKNPMAGKMKKMLPRWAGPYKVISKGDRIYKLADLDGTVIRLPFAREMLKLYYKRN